jgi:predicted site-specific integrase-resolvase
MIEKAKIEKPVSSDYVCKLIGVSRPALHRWSKAGTLKSFKIRKLY